MKTRLSAKGQITVPVEVRRKLGLRPGTVVEFELRPGEAVLRKGSEGAHPVDRVFGRIKLPAATDELLDETRGPRPGIAAGRRALGRRRTRS